MNSIIHNDLKSIVEPFSLDGIIECMKNVCFILYKTKSFFIYFMKPKTKELYLWNKISNTGFETDLIKEAIAKNKIIKKENFYAYPLYARNIAFGAIVIECKHLEIKDFSATADYFALLLYSEKLSLIAKKDKLTKIYNRFFVYDILEKYEKQSTPYSIIIFDIDKFKHYNDKYGHSIGDHVLKKLSYTLNKHMNKSSCFARYGGEEFIIILENSDEEKLYNTMENIRTLVMKTDFSTEEYALKITISLGGCVNKTNMPYSEVIEKADMALYKAKEEGRNKSFINKK